MNYTGNAIALIKRHTPFHAEPYLGKSRMQEIGYAHSIVRSETLPKKLTEKESDALLRADLEKIQIVLSVFVRAQLNQNQYDALVAFIHSIGESEFRASHMLHLINKYRFADAAEQFLTYNRRNGILNSDLSRRREEEKQLFIS